MKTLQLIVMSFFFAGIISAQSFSEINAPFAGVGAGSIAFSDVDNDGDKDVVITGLGNAAGGNVITRLYLNLDGPYREVPFTSLENVWLSSIAFSDIDSDGDDDLLMTGANDGGGKTGKLYTNENGVFTEQLDVPFEEFELSALVFSDIDGDGDKDVIISGLVWESGRNVSCTKLYRNEGGSFEEILDTPFVGVMDGSMAFSDIDGDGDLDFLISGAPFESRQLASVVKLYKNTGGLFEEVQDTPFEGVWASSVAFSDVDNDGDEDILIAGRNDQDQGMTKLYLNVSGMFAETLNVPFEAVSSGSITFSDVDNDNDDDVLITGITNQDESIAKLYMNAEGVFSEALATPFAGVSASSVAFSDVDNDGDKDVLMTGLNDNGEKIAKLYINNLLINSINDAQPGLNFDFSIYLNPTKAQDINIEGDFMGLISVRVLDVQGRGLSAQEVLKQDSFQVVTVDIAHLGAGNYFIQLDDGKRQGLRSFVIE